MGNTENTFTDKKEKPPASDFAFYIDYKKNARSSAKIILKNILTAIPDEILQDLD